MSDDWKTRIATHPDVMTGKAVVKGTRVTVERILYLLGEGLTAEQILEEFPHLKREDVQACLMYGAGLAGSEEIIPLPEQRSA